MQTFKDASTEKVWAFEDDVHVTKDTGGVYNFHAADGTPLTVPDTLEPFTPPAAAAPTLSQVQSAQNDAINAAANADLAQIIAAYPELEALTWPQQLAEATAYTADNKASTPMLYAISTVSGETVSALAANVLSKAAAYTSEAGAVIGKRISLQTKVGAAKTVAAVQKIAWA